MKPEYKLNLVTHHNSIMVSYLKLLLRRPYHMLLKKWWILLISMQGMSNNSNDNKSTYRSNTYLYITQQTRSSNSTIRNTTFTATWLERGNWPWLKPKLALVKNKPNIWPKYFLVCTECTWHNPWSLIWNKPNTCHTFLYRMHSALSLKPGMKRIYCKMHTLSCCTYRMHWTQSSYTPCRVELFPVLSMVETNY